MSSLLSVCELLSLILNNTVLDVTQFYSIMMSCKQTVKYEGALCAEMMVNLRKLGGTHECSFCLYEIIDAIH